MWRSREEEKKTVSSPSRLRKKWGVGGDKEKGMGPSVVTEGSGDGAVWVRNFWVGVMEDKEGGGRTQKEIKEMSNSR